MSEPQLGNIARTDGIAGQVRYSVKVTFHPDEEPMPVSFISSIYGGPVVMDWRMGQTFITEPSRFGPFGPEWVRRFFSAGSTAPGDGAEG